MFERMAKNGLSINYEGAQLISRKTDENHKSTLIDDWPKPTRNRGNNAII
jgi:hypothetical protein